MARVAVIAALTLTMAVITGCGKEADKDNTPAEASLSVVQEATPSTDEAQEATAEVVESTESKTMDAVESTEEAKEVNIEEIINNIDFSKYANAGECINDLKQYETLMLIVYTDQGGKEILIDGDYHTYDETVEDERFYLNRSPADSEIKETYIKSEEGIISATATNRSYRFPFETYFTDGLYTIVVVYNNGTKEEINIEFTFTQD